MSTLVLLQASVTLYVRVITIGQVPATSSELLTVRAASTVQTSVIIKFPGRASNSATVVFGAGAALSEQPFTTKVSRDPVTIGGVVSSMLIM